MEGKIIEKKVNRKRPITYSFRVSEQERKIIDEKIKSSGLNRTEFLIRALRNKPVTVIEQGGELLTELKRQGNNLNQALRNSYLKPGEKQEILSAVKECKEALAISNEKCNKLIEMQNKLIEEMRANMAVTEYDLTTTVDKAVREIKTETAKTEKLNESIGIQVKKAVSTSVNEMKAEMLINVRDTLSKTQEEIRKTEKEMERLRENIRFESGFRKFLLWLTPALLVVQTIVLAISLL